MGREGVEVKRIALTMDQIDQYNPPPNPAKITDSRAESYIMEYGYESWELDALDPTTLDGLITEEVEAVLDHDAWEDSSQRQDDERQVLSAMSANFETVRDYLTEEGLL